MTPAVSQDQIGPSSTTYDILPSRILPNRVVFAQRRLIVLILSTLCLRSKPIFQVQTFHRDVLHS